MKKRSLSYRQLESLNRHKRMRINQNRRREELRIERANAADCSLVKEHEEILSLNSFTKP
jgi:hypothetical protein